MGDGHELGLRDGWMWNGWAMVRKGWGMGERWVRGGLENGQKMGKAKVDERWFRDRWEVGEGWVRGRVQGGWEMGEIWEMS